MNTIITVYGKNLEFENDFLELYEKTTLTSLKDIAACFVEAECNILSNFNNEKRTSLIDQKTQEELKDIILKWAVNDLRHYGVNYNL